MQVTSDTLFMVNQMLTRKAKSALEMIWDATDEHFAMTISETDEMCLEYEALMALHLVTDEPESALPECRKFWLTQLGYEYTKGLTSK